MSKYIIYINIIVALAFSNDALGQKLSINNKNFEIKEDRTTSQLLEIEVSINDTIKKDLVLELVPTNLGTANNKDYRIINSTLLFKPNQKLTNPFIIEIYGDTIPEGNESLIFKLISSDNKMIDSVNNYYLITILDAVAPPKKESDNSNFKFFLGANFDLNDGLDPNHFYKEISFFAPDILYKTLNPNKIKFPNKSKWNGGFGIYGGMYQTKSTSIDSTTNRTERFFYPINTPSINDSVNVVNQVYRPRISGTIKNLGLYFSPFVKLNPLSEDNLKTFAGIHFEFIKRRFEYNYTYTLISSDTTVQVVTPTQYNRLLLLTKRTSERYDTYWGLTFPITYTNKGYELNLRPVLGFAIISVPNSSIQEALVGSYRKFYAVQFNLAAINSGFNIGGEIRGFYGQRSAIATIQLSKILSVKKIGEAIVGTNSSD